MAVSEQYISTNYTPGRGDNRLRYIVLHTVAGTAEGAMATFNNPAKQRSAHEVIKLNGDRIMCVREGDTSWGAANWPVNQQGYNIEHEDNGNYDDAVRTDALYAASAARVAELCRKNGIQCKLIGVNNTALRSPLEDTGIVLHKQVSQRGTACPDGLDHSRIIAQAQAILGGAVPAVLAVESSSVVGGVAWGPAKVRVAVQTLRVHATASQEDAGNFGNTPDGMVHMGDLIDVNGYVDAQTYEINGLQSNRWLHTTNGHFVAAAGTDFGEQSITSNVPLKLEPVIEPEAINEFIAFEGTATVITQDGMNVRTAPRTDAALNPTNTAGGVLGHGESFAVSGYKHTGINQDLTAAGGTNTDIWVRSQYGNWISAAGLSVTPALPEPTPPEPPRVPAPVAPTPTSVPAFVKTYEEKHDVVVARQTVEAVDLADTTGNPTKRLVSKGQSIDRAATFTTEQGGFIRTESSASRGAWFGIPLSVLEDAPLNATGGRLMDIVAKPQEVPAVETAEDTESYQLIQILSRSWGGILALLDKVGRAFGRKGAK